MRFNPSKCHIMSVGTTKKFTSSTHYADAYYPRCHTPSTWGWPTLSEDLQWNQHVSSVTAKTSQTLECLRRNLKGCPAALKDLAYFSLVRSKLEYASAAWDPHTVRDKELRDKVHRRGARFVRNDYRSGSSVILMLTDLQWMPLEERRRNTRLHMLDKIAGGRVAINLWGLCAAYQHTDTVNKQCQTEAHWCKNSYLQELLFFHEQ